MITTMEEVRLYVLSDFGKVHLSKDGKKTLCSRSIDPFDSLELTGVSDTWNEHPEWRCKICQKKNS